MSPSPYPSRCLIEVDESEADFEPSIGEAFNSKQYEVPVTLLSNEDAQPPSPSLNAGRDNSSGRVPVCAQMPQEPETTHSCGGDGFGRCVIRKKKFHLRRTKIEETPHGISKTTYCVSIDEGTMRRMAERFDEVQRIYL